MYISIYAFQRLDMLNSMHDSMYPILYYPVIGFVFLVFAFMMVIDITGILKKTKSRSYSDSHISKNPTSAYMPKTLVIIPCKGIDFSLEGNLKSVKNQKYKNFDSIAVVDSESDPAIRYIKKSGLRYIIADSKCEACSGKVKAISTALEKFRDYDVYVIADSDVEMPKGWLEDLVSPLQDNSVGISTSYPYFMHFGGFWSKIKSVWGLVGEGLMENESTRFGWGGSIAFRKDLLGSAESVSAFKNSKYSISDDITLTKISESKGLEIAYVKKSQPIVKTKDDFKTFMEWANRQTALSITGNRKNLYTGIIFYLSESILILSGISFAILISPIFLLLLIHYARSLITTWKRSRQKGGYIIIAALVVPFIYLYNLLHANGMKRIIWRGSVYSLPKV